MEARPFQAALLDRARDAIRGGARRILLQLPTGGGKTFIAGLIMRGMVARKKLPWFLVHRLELLEQTAETFGRIDLDHGLIAPGHPHRDAALTQLVGIQYAVRRLAGLGDPDALIIDEAHHAVAGQWGAILDHFDGKLQLGLSATPERLDGRGLGDRFDVLIQGPSVSQLIGDGFLSPFRYFAPGRPDLAGVRSRGGDFARDELAAVMGDADLIGDAVEHYLAEACGEQGITFAVDRNHSRQIAASFNAAGISAAHIDGTMTKHERAAIVGAFRRGELRIMCNVELFGEGFDVPGIVYLGMFRPTKSLAMCMQQWGRALRIMEGKEAAVICDHAGNTFLHGLPDFDRKWSLESRARGSRSAADAMAIHTCPMCYQVTPSQRRVCPCGYVFTVRERSLAWAEGQLFELRPDEQRAKAQTDKAAMRKREEEACRSYGDFFDLALARGYKSPAGWAKNKLAMRRGRGPGRQRWSGGRR
jgi:DNA repair protein RadD